jgi:cytochrome b561
MLALVLRGFLQRKLRVLLTAIAIALGVALMAGTYIRSTTRSRTSSPPPTRATPWLSARQKRWGAK